uniref:Uncharacterized protein n=1 Tax=Nelumbo nucifera TaxID=4432 RepID=A0A822Y459_NELNU|nr:TPA_asm: hypothetical protein HUJ06_027474 [Nelumbo nucifera]
MQRLAGGSSSRATDESVIISSAVDDLPVFAPSEDVDRKDNTPRNRSSKKWVHIIPVIVLLCILILWWFSHPVNVVIKDGNIVAVNRITLQPSNDTQANNANASPLTTPKEYFVSEELKANKEADTLGLVSR